MPLLVMDRTTRGNISKDIEYLNNTINLYEPTSIEQSTQQ